MGAARRHDAAVVGAGVVGAATAYHLARLGRSVVLVDAGAVGQGSTARSVGGFRSLHRHRVEAELSQASAAEFRWLEETAGARLGRRAIGQALAATSPARAAALGEALAHARALGVAAEELDAADLAARVGGVRVDGVRRAALAPADFSCDHPEAAATAYAHLAARAGVEVVEQQPVERVEAVAGGFVLRGRAASWDAEQVVVTANAWAGPLLERLGVHLPAYPYPRHVFRCAAAGGRPGQPVCVFQDEDVYLRRERDGWLGVVGLREESTTDERFDPGRLAGVALQFERRLLGPVSAVEHGWSGLRSVTPDRRAIVGALPGVEGAWCAVGFSGHGFMHAPATGRALASRAAEGRWSGVDLSELGPERFASVGPPPVLEPGHQ